MCKTLKILNIITLCFCVIFSFLQVPTVADLSMVALFLSVAFSCVLVYFAFYTLQFRSNPKFYKVANKLYEYAPYVFLTAFVFRRAGAFSTSFAYDVVSVIAWLLVAILSFVVSRFFLNEKYFYKRNPDFKKPDVHKKKIGKKAAKEALEWIDAFVQAVFAIILLNIFIFQLYVIPSESMVDEFLIGDRVLVFKVSSGPKFPMTKVGLKDVKKYERGDITVFHNPQYPDTRKKELQNFYSQMVFMLTLTKVNLNVDENGNPMADPLVKRVCGVGGEQLVMLDGVLYHRTKDSDEFTPVKEDSKWANWNLNELPNAKKVKIQRMPFTQAQYEMLLACEDDRRNFDVANFAREAKDLSAQFSNLASVASRQGKGVPQKAKSFRSDELHGVLNSDDRDVYALFSKNELVTQTLLSSEYGAAWFDAFVTDWIKSVPDDVLQGRALYGGDMYTDSLFRMNLMIKQTVAKLILCNANLILSPASSSYDKTLLERQNLLQTAEKQNLYMALNDSRNMMVFPANAQDGSANYIPDGSYFMMGDNRFNSLDMRHSYDYKQIPLVGADDFSVTYSSMLDPKYVSHTQMLGSPCFRIWPFSRLGVIHSKRAK